MTVELPRCGTCPFALMVESKPDLVWCHGGPPTAASVKVNDTEAAITTNRPLLSKQMVGCGLHPRWPKPALWTAWK